MSTTSTAKQASMQLSALTEELHQFLANWHSKSKSESDSVWMEAMRQRCRELSARAAGAKVAATAWWDELGDNWPRTRKAAERLSANLDRMTATLAALSQEMQESPRWASSKRCVQRLSVNYEELLRSVRGMKLHSLGYSIRLPHFKPMNFARNIFHVANGLGAFALSAWVLTPFQCVLVLLGMSVFVGSLETIRAFHPGFNRALCGLPIFKYTMRPRELNRVNSASVFAWTLTGVTILAPLSAVQVGLLILTFADPAASLVGKKWGTYKLWKQKSLAGSAAFFGVALVCSALGFGLLAGLPWGLSVGFGAVVALTTAVTELLSDRLDDNFTVLGMGAAVAGLCLLLI